MYQLGKYFRFCSFPYIWFFSTIIQASRGEKAIFKKELIRLLTRKKKGKLKEDRIRVIDKLKKQERLTDDEFWRVYESIRQEGPEVKYQNPQNWELGLASNYP